MSEREIGSVLDAKYEILNRLGGGGMGEVYRVRHLHLAEERVIKVLRPEDAADPTAQTRFLRAARSATQIKHPNVAILYDYSSLPDGSYYVVWEYVDGEDVGHWIERRGPFPAAVALDLGIQALRGLEAIHSLGVIHRDISPDNLMLCRDVRGKRRLKIIDLGLAKSLVLDPADSEVTQQGMFMGKLRYCSPEQAGMVDGVELDRRSDLYSFAVVLYEMLSGKAPFESSTPHGAIFKRLTEDPLSLVGRVPGLEIPAALDRVVRHGLQRDRDQRFPTAVAFIEALERVQRDLAQVSTREMAAVGEETERRGAPTDGSEAVAKRPATPPRGNPGGGSRRTPSHLSKGERDRLLEQIHRAAQRQEQTRSGLLRAEEALVVGRLDEARRLAREIEKRTPGTPGLAALKARIEAEETASRAARPTVGRSPGAPAPPTASGPAPPERRAPAAKERAPAAKERAPARAGQAPAAAAAAKAKAAPETPSPTERVGEAEQMLARYLASRQLPLARLALETLLELAPDHPRRTEHERAIRALAEESERVQRVEKVLAEAQQELAKGDVKGARRRLSALRRADSAGELAATFAAELTAAEEAREQTARLAERRASLEEQIGRGRLQEAERELAALAETGVARVTLDLYRRQIGAARAAGEDQRRGQALAATFDERIAGGDWLGARETALEVERDLPHHPRLPAMFAEIERVRAEAERRLAIDQGEQQVEAFIAAGRREQASIALEILLKIDPGHPRRKHLERRIAAL